MVPSRLRGPLALLAVVLLAVLFVWGQRFGEDRQPSGTIIEPSDRVSATQDPSVEPSEGAAGETIAFSALPPEGREVVEQIRAGGPFRYDRDGSTFGNREGLLPDRPRGWYREYTVPTPGSEDRGARRIVAGQNGDLFYTADHYASFRLIVGAP